MSIRNLDLLFDPQSVAVIGATEREGSVGATVWRNLRDGGFAGARWPVNLKRASVFGERCFRDVAALPATPDLALICTPPDTVPSLIEQLGERGTRAAIVLTAGLDAPTRAAMLESAGKYLLRILGPNCLGLLSPHASLNASFAHTSAQAGSLAFVSQSGALVTAMLDWAQDRGIGFSHFASIGEHADIDFADMLDWLANDARTRSILLYVEAIEAPRKFMSAARAAARNKPVLVVKAGRSLQGQVAAASHTGALAGSDLVYDAAIRRAGMLRVDTLADLFMAAETLSHYRGPPAGADAERLDRLTLVTNGGGAGVMAADAAALAGVSLAPLSDATLATLDAQLPRNWSRGNPLDIIGDAPVERYVATLQALLADPESGTLLFMHAPTAIVPSAEIARALVPVMQAAPQRIFSCWLGGPAVAEARHIFNDAGIPSYATPEEAVRAFALLVTYRRNQQQLIQAPPAASAHAAPRMDRVREIIDAVLAQGRQLLTEPEAKALLDACGIPVVATQVVAPSAEAAVAAAEAIGYPAVLKVLSEQISHKSDVGGVALGLHDAEAVRDAAASMLARVAHVQPDAVVSGFTVQAMVRRPRALELIVGASIDPLFGPVILFGQGGTSVEVVADRAIALPPLNAPLAQALIERTRVAKLLQGWRDVPPADNAAIAGVLTAISQLLADEPRIAEIDINPLLADADGVVALDARVVVSTAAPGGADNFAIRPYPAGLVETVQWHGRAITLRPIRPEDEVQHLEFLEKLDPVDVRMRVFYSRRSIERSELARLTQIDYEREMAFIATAPSSEGEETLGVVRATSDPDNRDAEFGIIVRSDLKGSGLGERLMRKLIGYLRAKGTQRLVAQVLRENTRMLELARRLGFALEADQPDPRMYAISLRLQ
ncbi:MAG TPA: bifunctional acetate--CoA ligase family protein/GNAT family N-acetyltransferase [Lysobacter sp.]|nr:bifunctional acetate--CoA ligase family protein/GNAT family N-acetyltransferase [Lysobacter sp.]